jgi:hypothetical protein
VLRRLALLARDLTFSVEILSTAATGIGIAPVGV